MRLHAGVVDRRRHGFVMGGDGHTVEDAVKERQRLIGGERFRRVRCENRRWPDISRCGAVRD